MAAYKEKAQDKLVLRPYQTGDNPALAALFYQTVHTVNCRDYSPAQLAVWAPEQLDPEAFGRPFAESYSLVALRGPKVVGFGNIEQDGYLDRLYVHADCQGQKVGTRLLAQLESWANRQGAQRVWAQVSVSAVPFFTRRGYAVRQEHLVERQGQQLRNYWMEKWLNQ